VWVKGQRVDKASELLADWRAAGRDAAAAKAAAEVASLALEAAKAASEATAETEAAASAFQGTPTAADAMTLASTGTEALVASYMPHRVELAPPEGIEGSLRRADPLDWYASPPP
jgi:hypothetical protein